jgi:hypothetical protein
VIEPTDEMVEAFEREGTGGYGDIVDTRAGLAAALALFVRRIEGKRDTGLCDCVCDDEPVSPRTRKPMEHHCDCMAVTTAGVLLGDRRKTRHVAECTCNWDEL